MKKQPATAQQPARLPIVRNKKREPPSATWLISKRVVILQAKNRRSSFNSPPAVVVIAVSSKPKRIYVATSVKNISVIYNCTHSDPINLLRQTPCWLPTRCERHSINSFVCSKSGVPRTSRFHLALVRVTREVIIREGSRTVGVIYQDGG